MFHPREMGSPCFGLFHSHRHDLPCVSIDFDRGWAAWASWGVVFLFCQLLFDSGVVTTYQNKLLLFCGRAYFMSPKGSSFFAALAATTSSTRPYTAPPGRVELFF